LIGELEEIGLMLRVEDAALILEALPRAIYDCLSEELSYGLAAFFFLLFHLV